MFEVHTNIMYVKRLLDFSLQSFEILSRTQAARLSPLVACELTGRLANPNVLKC